jgi:recombination DNA repair RAD52 pathway protein
MSTFGLTGEQHDYLLNPLRSSRIATRSQGGKNLSYLESWEVRAHLNRIFGFTNWDLDMIDYDHVADRPYRNNDKDMVEVIWKARMRLAVKDQYGEHLASYTEAAVGSASGPANLLAELHDNALKTAASDAMKRCAINLGTQFGLSLYDDGSRSDVVQTTLVFPEGSKKGTPAAPTPEQVAALAHSAGAEQKGEQK